MGTTVSSGGLVMPMVSASSGRLASYTVWIENSRFIGRDGTVCFLMEARRKNWMLCEQVDMIASRMLES